MKVLRRTLPWLLLAAVCGCGAGGPPGSLDRSFGSDGFATVSTSAQWVAAGGAVVQPQDGKLLVAGQEHLRSGVNNLVITRLLASGRRDPSFGKDGITTVPNGGTDSGADIALLTGRSWLPAPRRPQPSRCQTRSRL